MVWRTLNAVEKVGQNREGGTQEDIPSHSTREGSSPARRKLQPRLGSSPEVWLVMEDFVRLCTSAPQPPLYPTRYARLSNLIYGNCVEIAMRLEDSAAEERGQGKGEAISDRWDIYGVNTQALFGEVKLE